MPMNATYQGPGDLAAVIPVFPLPGALLLPRGQMPLNIFEPRYVAMVDDALRGGHRLIGMIQPDPAHPGPENKPNLYKVGCVGRITQIAETGDGRYLLQLTGIARFRVEEELTVTVYGPPGSLDTSFRGGKVVLPAGESDDYATAITTQADGKILIAGYAYENAGDFALVRLERDGKLDESFGEGGKVLTDFEGRSDQARAIAPACSSDSASASICSWRLAPTPRASPANAALAASCSAGRSISSRSVRNISPYMPGWACA